MGIDKFDNRYKYYLYPTEDVSKCLKSGVEIPCGAFLVDNFESVNSYDFENVLNEYINNYNNEVNSFLVVRIPLYYMGWRHRNGVKESFVPILKNEIDVDTLLLKSYLIPELIYCFYDKEKKMIIYNDKYNLFYDPNGLQFCSEQIQNMFDLRCYDLYQESLHRQKYDYYDLYKEDVEKCIWDKTIKYYESCKIKKKILNLNKNKFGRR